MLKKVKKNKYWICAFVLICDKFEWVLSWPMPHPSKFSGNQFGSFCKILLTNKHIDRGKNITTLVRVKKTELSHWPPCFPPFTDHVFVWKLGHDWTITITWLLQLKDNEIGVMCKIYSLT